MILLLLIVFNPNILGMMQTKFVGQIGHSSFPQRSTNISTITSPQSHWQHFSWEKPLCITDYSYWINQGISLAPSDELAQYWAEIIARVENSNEAIQAKFNQMLNMIAENSLQNVMMSQIFPDISKKFHTQGKDVVVARLMSDVENYKQVFVKDLKQNSRFLGDYIFTSDFQFQEQARKNDIFMSDFIRTVTDPERANAFLINGWGQILGTLMAVRDARVSPDFKKVIDQNLKVAIEKGRSIMNPLMHVNVRKYGKDIWMYPHQGIYNPFQLLEIKEPVAFLNRIITEYKPHAELFNSKLFLKIETGSQTTLFKRVWATNFNDLLVKKGFLNITPTKQLPHITLFLPEVYATIRQKFQQDKKTEQFEPYMKQLIDTFNTHLAEVKSPITFTELGATFSEDYAPYKIVIIAKVKAQEVLTLFNELRDRVKKDIAVEIPELKESDLHVTLGAEFRTANQYPIKNVSQLLKWIPAEYSDDIQKFFENFNV